MSRVLQSQVGVGVALGVADVLDGVHQPGLVVVLVQVELQIWLRVEADHAHLRGFRADVEALHHRLDELEHLLEVGVPDAAAGVQQEQKIHGLDSTAWNS